MGDPRHYDEEEDYDEDEDDDYEDDEEDDDEEESESPKKMTKLDKELNEELDGLLDELMGEGSSSVKGRKKIIKSTKIPSPAIKLTRILRMTKRRSRRKNAVRKERQRWSTKAKMMRKRCTRSMKIATNKFF